MDRKVDISVIIPTYNRKILLQDLIESWRAVKCASNYSFELIFSDDGSNDGTSEFLRKLNDLPVAVLSNVHKGVSFARNEAIKNASGRRILFVGDDIFPNPNIINQHSFMSKRFQSNYAILGKIEWHPTLSVNYLMQHITEIGCEQFAYPRLQPFALTNYQHFYTSNISIDKDFLMMSNGFFSDKFYKVNYEDTELGYRLSKNGLKIFYCPDIVVHHYHPYTMSKFCERQKTAGEMAIVLGQIHPELEKIIEVNRTLNSFEKYYRLHDSSIIKHIVNRTYSLDQIESFCDLLEQSLNILPGRNKEKIKRLLSSIYSKLFRIYYELGIVSTSRKIETEECKRYLMVKYFAWNFVWDYERLFFQLHNIQDEITTLIKCENKIMLGIHKGIISSKHEQKYEKLQIIKSSKNESLILKSIFKLIRFSFGLTSMLINKSSNIIPIAAKYFQFEKTSEAKLIKLIINLDEMPPLDECKIFFDIFGNDHIFLVISDKDESCLDYTLQKKLIEKDQVNNFDYVYSPSCWKNIMKWHHLKSVMLAFCVNQMDFAMVSYSLELPPIVGIKSMQDQIVYSTQSKTCGHGRLLRLLPAPSDVKTADIQEFVPHKIKIWRGRRLIIDKKHLFNKDIYRNSEISFIPQFAKKKQLVFVLPTFLAVGGVERNTIEVIKKLNNEYHFVIINFVSLNKSLGSLHHQFSNEVEGIYDLSEITDEINYLNALRQLRIVYNPDLIWICNGCPWLHENLTNLRNLFKDIPIVDQQVYDEKEGWINIFHEKPVKSFDRFIAINKKIYIKFVEQFQISEDKIDLIYSAIDIDRILDERKKMCGVNELLQELGIPANKRIFLFIGRLTSQKRPLDFLKLATYQQSQNNTEDHFVLIGDGELSSKVDSAIHGNKLRNVTRIKFVENLIPVYNVSSGIIFLSQYEGLPMAMLEALSVGCPVLATDVGDIRAVIEEYNVGLIIDRIGDNNLINNKFEEFKNNLPTYSTNAKKSSEKIALRFSSHSVSKQYSESWQKAIKYKGIET